MNEDRCFIMSQRTSRILDDNEVIESKQKPLSAVHIQRGVILILLVSNLVLASLHFGIKFTW